MLASFESFFHRLRRHFSQSERLVRKLGLPVAENSGELPGLLLVALDGLSRTDWKALLDTAQLPFIRRLQEREGYQLLTLRSPPDDRAPEIDGDVPTPNGFISDCEETLRESLRQFPLRHREDREALLLAARMDLVRGLPVVRVHFPCGSGTNGDPPQPWPPARIDQALRDLTREAHRSRRRDYHVWVYLGPTTDVPGVLLVPPATGLFSHAKPEITLPEMQTAMRALLQRRITVPPHPLFSGILTVMSYNVHGCIGMDGRVSPRRISRVIARENVDFVALQELDHGRPRSRAEDQAGEIAAELGFQLLFCPTVVRGNERYGHALLSRWPMEAVKIGPLPSRRGGLWPEPRGAIWARIHVGENHLNVLSTHLGLGAAERREQMTALLGPEWLSPILDREPVILCGDFNLTPGSPAHRLATSRLRDVAHAFKRGVPTFSSLRLVAQLDHIFVSPHFGLETVFAARNDLTRIASDHLPLVAHVRLPGK